jgi:hypothetical protein
MDPVSILLGVAFPTLFFTGLGLALATVGHTAFLVARACFCLAALDLLALTVWWLYTTETAGWKLVIGVAIGAVAVGVLPDVLRWVDGNEKDVIELRQLKIGKEATDIAPLIAAIRQNQTALAESEQTRNLFSRILGQYDNLQNGINVHEQITHARQIDGRLAAAEHIISELKIALGSIHTNHTPQGVGLIIKSAPNTFRVTFPVPMRIPPNVTFQNVPTGSTPNIIEKSTIGLTIVFTPQTIPVETLPPMTASAEL